MNGFKDKVFNNPSKIESIELVLEDLEKMNVVSYFKNLRNITLINVSLTAIEVKKKKKKKKIKKK
jgi:hypothetical protein